MENDMSLSSNTSENKRKTGLMIAVPVLAALQLIILAYAIFFAEPSLGLLLGLFGTAGVGMLSFGVIRLVCGAGKKAPGIVFTAVGGFILITVLWAAFYYGLLRLTITSNYDYTKELGNVSSIEYIRVDEAEKRNGVLYDSGFSYTVLASVAPEKWQSFLESATLIEYRAVPPHPSLSKGQELFLITYKYPDDGVVFVIIAQNAPGYGKRFDSRIRFYTDGTRCDKKEWNKLVEQFVE